MQWSDSRSWLIPRYGGVIAERIRRAQVPNYSGKGPEPDRMWFGAIAVFAFVRILLLLADGTRRAAANHARKDPLIGDALIARSLSREITLY